MTPLDKPARPVSRARRFIRAGLLLFAILFVAFNAIAFLQAWRLTHFTSSASTISKAERRTLSGQLKALTEIAGTPRNRELKKPDFETTPFEVTTSDGLKLQGWYNDAPSGGTSGTVILSHGHGANRSGVNTEAEAFHEMGFRVVCYDFRAHGESSGTLCSVGYHEIGDLAAVWQWVRDKHPDDPIVLYGISMGAVASARAIAELKLQPAAVILEMPFDRLIDAVRVRLRLMKLPSEPGATILTFWGGVITGMWPFGTSTSENVSQVPCPILIQSGEADKRVSRNEIQRIYQSAPSGQATLQFYKDIGHTSLCRWNRSLWLATVTPFLQHALQASSN